MCGKVELTSRIQRPKKPSEVPNQNLVSVKKTLKQIRREEREHQEKLERKRYEREEKKKVLPPKLGKHRFQPELNHVSPLLPYSAIFPMLTYEEIRS